LPVANLQKYKLAVKEILRDRVVCSHVAGCKILNCPHRRPHSPLTCPIIGTPRRSLLISPLDDECPLNLDDLRCLHLDTLVVVHGEKEI
jgi:hypothetical protein